MLTSVVRLASMYSRSRFLIKESTGLYFGQDGLITVSISNTLL